MPDYDNTILIYPNSYKKPEDNKPSMVGSLTVHGEKFSIALWAKVNSKGGKYLTGVIKPEDEPKKHTTKEHTETQPANKQNDNEDLPF